VIEPGASGPGAPRAAATADVGPGEADERRPEVIRLEGVTRVYPVGSTLVRALDGVTLHVHQGEFVALMGPSGSGKSTLLNVIGCLDTPSAGRYVLDGEDVSALDEVKLAAIRGHKIGFVFQSFHLVPRMTAARNVELPLLLRGEPPATRHARVSAALDAVGLAGRATHRPDQLSGGERQRVAIARAMVTGPRILLADEPTGNLDSKTGAEIVALIRHLNEDGLTVVVVTHDPGVASYAARLLTLRDGRLTSDTAMRDVEALSAEGDAGRAPPPAAAPVPGVPPRPAAREKAR
jgi:putative ABC transport system ATP-binding protein